MSNIDIEKSLAFIMLKNQILQGNVWPVTFQQACAWAKSKFCLPIFGLPFFFIYMKKKNVYTNLDFLDKPFFK